MKNNYIFLILFLQSKIVFSEVILTLEHESVCPKTTKEL